MKKKQVKRLLDAVKPFALVAPSYDMKGIKKEDSETLSVGHWLNSPLNPLGQDFSAVMAFKLADFRELANAFVEVQREIAKPKIKKVKKKKNNRA